jgi:hypothetical protein
MTDTATVERPAPTDLPTEARPPEAETAETESSTPKPKRGGG